MGSHRKSTITAACVFLQPAYLVYLHLTGTHEDLNGAEKILSFMVKKDFQTPAVKCSGRDPIPRTTGVQSKPRDFSGDVTE